MTTPHQTTLMTSDISLDFTEALRQVRQSVQQEDHLIKCEILHYDSRNQRLKSAYGILDLKTTIKASDSTTRRVDVNGQTDRVTYRILQVQFSGGTPWKP